MKILFRFFLNNYLCKKYDEAHLQALEIHNVQPQALYTPEIVQEYYKWFNKADYEYWGITIEK